MGRLRSAVVGGLATEIKLWLTWRHTKLSLSVIEKLVLFVVFTEINTEVTFLES